MSSEKIRSPTYDEAENLPRLHPLRIHSEGVPTTQAFIPLRCDFLVHRIPYILLDFLLGYKVLPTALRVGIALGFFKLLRDYHWQNQLEAHII